MGSEDSPLAGHAATPAELQRRIAAQRAGDPFLVVRDGDGHQHVVVLSGSQVSVGRGADNDVALGWDGEVSRLHAELEKLGGQWMINDDGLSRNGTYVAGTRIGGRTRLRDGDVIRLGATTMAFCDPGAEETRERTQIGEPPLLLADLTPTQRSVLIALARPFKHGTIATPTTNQEIAEELHLSIDAVKAQLRALYIRMGVGELPQHQKRQQLVAQALERGTLSSRDL